MEEIRSLDIRDEYGGDADLCEHEVAGESFYKKRYKKYLKSHSINMEEITVVLI